MSASNQSWTTAVRGEAGFRIVLAIACCIHVYEDGLNGSPIRSDGFGYHAYLFEVSLVQDGVAWFHDLGMKVVSAPVPVEAAS